MLYQPQYFFNQVGHNTYENFKGLREVGTVEAKSPQHAVQQLKEWGYPAPIVQEYKSVEVAKT